MSSVGHVAKETTKKVVKKAAVQAIKSKVNIVTMKYKLIIAGIILVLVILVVFIAGIISSISSGNNTSSSSISGYGLASISPEVEAYRDDISSELAKYNLEEYTDLLLALMMQESGGRGNDPMQASESKCGYIGCITSPSESIKYGVKHFANVLEKSNGDIKLALQSYNFGDGFINYVMKNGGAYTKELAISFSQMMYEKEKDKGNYICHRPSAIEHNACYGDIEYVDAVLKYVPAATLADAGVLASVGNDTYQAILSEMTKYQGWSYVWGGNNPTIGFDCSGLMEWSYGQAGIKLPRTANEQYNATQRISREELQPGDLVFFTTANYAPVTHVGMYVGNGLMFNSQNSGIRYDEALTGYWGSRIVGYGRVADFSA